jgi:hypothetical protein
MVDPLRNAPTSVLDAESDRSHSPHLHPLHPVRVRNHRLWKITAVAATLLVGSGWALSSSGRDPTARASTPRSGAAPAHGVGVAPARQTTATTTSIVAVVATTTSTSAVTAPVKAAPVAAAPVVVPAAAPVAAAPVAAAPSLAQLVVEVETSGIEPGSNWSWSMGDTAMHCGAMTGAGTGCTYGSNGLEYSVFSGTPTLALVAHELANAETQNDAVPSLLNEVASAAGGTAWSPTDAVATCLVAHFMGFQDDAAGAWQCPATLATTTAANIHDSI